MTSDEGRGRSTNREPGSLAERAAAHPGVDHVSFTGSREAGSLVQQAADLEAAHAEALADPREGRDRPVHLLDANIFYPHTGTLAYSELNLVAGLFGLPWYAATHDPLAALNGSIAVGLWLAFMLMWHLVRRLTGSDGAGTTLTDAELALACSSHNAEPMHVEAARRMRQSVRPADTVARFLPLWHDYLAFYERYGAFPILGTLYDGPPPLNPSELFAADAVVDGVRDRADHVRVVIARDAVELIGEIHFVHEAYRAASARSARA